MPSLYAGLRGSEVHVTVSVDTWDYRASRFLDLPTQPVGLIEMRVRQNSQVSDYQCAERTMSIRVTNPEIFRVMGFSDGLDADIIANSWDPVKGVFSIKLGSYVMLDLGISKVIGSAFQLITLGFDFEWNPICYIQTGLGKLGTQRPPNTLLTSWSDVVRGVAKEIKAESCSEAWDLHGDRLQAINVQLESLLESQRGSHPCWVLVKMWREFTENEPTWIVRFKYISEDMRGRAAYSSMNR